MVNEHQLLSAISRVQEQFIRDAKPAQLFDYLLKSLIDLTQSEYGFIGEVKTKPDGQPFLRTQAITDIAWDEESRTFYENNVLAGLEFTNLDTLFGAVIRSGKFVISNNPARDPLGGGLPQGHPALNSFLGIPVHFGDRLVGMIGIANRKGGYDDAMVEGLQPLVRTYGHLTEANAVNQQRREALELLAASEDRFRQLSELSLDAILVHEKGIITDVNSSVTSMYGYSREELVGQNLIMLAAPDQKQRIAKKLAELPDEPYESVGLRKDGSTFIGSVYARTSKLDGRNIRCVAMRDLTSQKKIELELKQHRNHLEEMVQERAVELAEQASLIDDLRDSIISVDMAGEITLWNKGSERIWGFTQKETIGQNIYSVFDEKNHEFMRERIMVPLVKKGAHEVEVSLVNKTGEQGFFLLSLSVSHDTQGEPKGMVAYAIDITAQKRAEIKLQENESKYRALFELSQDAIMLLENDRFLDCNQAALDMFHCSRAEDFLGKHPADLSPPVQPDGRDSGVASRELISKAFDQGENFFEWVYQRLNGEDFPAEVQIKSIRLGDRDVLQAVVRDITEQKLIETALIASKEEAEFANNAKSEFLARMSHELRTPMNAILGFGQLLQFNDENLSEEQKEGIQHILTGGNHLLYLINEVLDIARVDSGNMDILLESLSLSQILDSSLLFVRPLLKKHDVTLHEPDDSDFFVLADEKRLKQVLVNLFSNAIKYNHEGGMVAIEIKTVENGFVRVSIIDNGQGIQVTDQASIFEPFIRVSNISGSTEGAGIGLTITRRLVEIMGGKIGFDSKIGKGSTFWIELPRVEAPSVSQT